MSRRRLQEHRGFLATLAVLALIAVVEGRRLHERIEAARGARAKLVALDREWQRAGAAMPADRTAELLRMRRELAALPREPAEAMAPTEVAARPATRAEAFFALAEFVEAMRERAGDHGVAIAAEERFGFAEYAQTGPATERIENVFRERQIAEFLLTVLFEARPARLIGVERPGSAAVGFGAPAGGSAGAEDVGPMAGHASEAGATRGFRMIFEGRTETLRALLNRLADESCPAVVRSVDVQRVEGRDGWQGRPEPGPAPLVRDRDSRFTVMIEWLAAGVPEPGGKVGAANAVTTHWAPPSAQRRGQEWNFEIFAPPEVLFDAESETFSVAAAAPVPAAMALPASADPETEGFGLELIEVKQARFRLQLIGFVGDEGRSRVLFENADSGETFLGNAGQDVTGLGVRIESVALKRRAVPLGESMTTHRRVATARVRDERTGEVVELDSLSRRLTDEPIAVVALHHDGADSERVHRDPAGLR